MSQDETEAIEWEKLMKRLDDMEKAIRDIDIEIDMIRTTLVRTLNLLTSRLQDDTPQKEVKSICSVTS